MLSVCHMTVQYHVAEPWFVSLDYIECKHKHHIDGGNASSLIFWMEFVRRQETIGALTQVLGWLKNMVAAQTFIVVYTSATPVCHTGQSQKR